MYLLDKNHSIKGENSESDANMSELEKMLAGSVYNCQCKELEMLRGQTSQLLNQFNYEENAELRHQLLVQAGIKIPADSCIVPPLEMSYSFNLSVGSSSYINSGAIILDNGVVSIGSNVMIGPRVQIYTASHALDAERRIAGDEVAKPVQIQDKVWIGGGAIILPGVTVGEGAIVGAGSIVTKNVEAYDRVAGNPARSIMK